MRKIYFIEDAEGTATFWKEEGYDSNGLFEVIHFWDPYEFYEYLTKQRIEEDSYIVADMLGDCFDNSKGFAEGCFEYAPYHKGQVILVSNNFNPGTIEKFEGFDAVYCKQEALEKIIESIKNEEV